MKMDRAGRKKQIERVLRDWDKRKRGSTMNTGMIAHRIGLRSSTHLVNILLEMEKDGIVQRLSTAPNSRYGYVFRTWRIAHYEQVSLPERFITINGEAMRAAW